MNRDPEIDLWITRLSTGDHAQAVQSLRAIGEPALHRLLQVLDGSVVLRWGPGDVRDLQANLTDALIALGTEHLDAFLAAIRASGGGHSPSVMLALSRIKDKRTLDALIDALDDPEPSVRATAADGLRRSRSPRAVGPLINALKDRAWNVRFEAVRALYGFGDERALEPLRKVLAAQSNANHPGIRELASKAIARIEARRRGGGKRRK